MTMIVFDYPAIRERMQGEDDFVPKVAPAMAIPKIGMVAHRMTMPCTCNPFGIVHSSTCKFNGVT